ncbi:MAG: hypothetical protein KC493_10220 [Bacteriovoracaceae bacterium]|nr:hypothetical protein [Bacteriovoracaceae bacterium]
MAWNLSHLELETSLLSPLSNEPVTQEIISHINDHQISFVGKVIKGKNPQQKIEIMNDGEKKFHPFEHGVLKSFSPDHFSIDYSDYSYVIGPLHNEPKPFFENFLKTKSQQQHLCLDFSDITEFSSRLDNLIHLINGSKVIQFGLKKSDTNLIQELLNLSLSSDQILLITLGADGVILKSNQTQSNFQTSNQGKILDTTGAGDAFFATFVGAMSKGISIENCIELALEKAAQTIQRVGSTTIEINVAKRTE